VVKLLLKHGADAQAATTTGWTAFHAASKNEHELVVKSCLNTELRYSELIRMETLHY